MNIKPLQETMRFLVAMIMLITVAACTTQGQITDPIQNTVVTRAGTPQLTHTPASAMAPQPALSAMPSRTAQITPTSPTTPSPTVIDTPSATLSVEARGQLLAEAMQTREDCRLPCWWGIVPGETSLGEARQILHEIGATALSDYYFAVFSSGWGMDIEFDVDDDIIQSLDIASPYVPARDDEVAYNNAWKHYSVVEIVQQYGVPSQVVTFIPFQADPGSGPTYMLFLFYEESGVVIQYSGTSEQLTGGRFQICPEINKPWAVDLLLYQPNRVGAIVQKMIPPENLVYIEPNISYDQITWEGITGTSLEEFQELFASNAPDEACYEIPDLWNTK